MAAATDGDRLKIEVIHSVDKAMQISKKYLNPHEDPRRVEIQTSHSLPIVAEIAEGPWSMSEVALENTLAYVMDYLHHPCYLLCVANEGRKMYKLDSRTGAPQFKKKAEEQVRKGLSQAMTGEQRKYVASVVAKPFRVMQCIVKPLAGETETVSFEYGRWMALLQIPAGVYVLNLTDAVLVRKDGGEPFPAVMGKGAKLPKSFFPLLPVFSLSGQDGYWDIPMPNYDDLQYGLGMGDGAAAAVADFVTGWAQKTEDRAVFRGGASGCGLTPATNPRLRLAEKVQTDPEFAKWVDGGLVSVDSRSVKFDPVEGLGVSNTRLVPVKRMTMAEQSRYKYILHIDGNVAAYRLLYTMLTGSLIVRLKSPYSMWSDAFLQEGVHYVGLTSLDDLPRVLAKCQAKPVRSSHIALRGMQEARRLLAKSFLVAYTEHCFREVGKLCLSDKCLPLPERAAVNPWMAKFDQDRERIHAGVRGETLPAPSAPVLVSEPIPALEARQALTAARIAVPAADVADTYLKASETEKCRKGYETDRKNKLLCKKTVRVRKPVAATKAPQEPAKESPLKSPAGPSPLKSPAMPPAPVMNNSPDGSPKGSPTSYLKTSETEKCRKGYETDRKNKLLCKKTVRIRVRKPVPAVAQKMPTPFSKPPSPENSPPLSIPPSPTETPTTPAFRIPVPSPKSSASPKGSPATYLKTSETEKCRKGYETDRKNKLLCKKTVRIRVRKPKMQVVDSNLVEP